MAIKKGRWKRKEDNGDGNCDKKTLCPNKNVRVNIFPVGNFIYISMKQGTTQALLPNFKITCWGKEKENLFLFTSSIYTEKQPPQPPPAPVARGRTRATESNGKIMESENVWPIRETATI